MERDELLRTGGYAKVVETYGDEDFAYEIISNAAEDMMKNLELMKEEAESGNFSEYGVYAHGNKGLMKTIFNDEMTEHSLKHEMAAKEDRYDYIKEDFEAYYAKCMEVCRQILG